MLPVEPIMCQGHTTKKKVAMKMAQYHWLRLKININPELLTKVALFTPRKMKIRTLNQCDLRKVINRKLFAVWKVIANNFFFQNNKFSKSL